MRIILITLLAAFAIVFPSTAPAATCTAELPAGGNVQTFLSGLPANGVGCLHGGSYSAGSLTFPARDGVTLQSYPFERATVNLGPYLYVPPAATNATIDSLNLVAGAANAVSLQLNGNGVRLLNSDVTNNHAAESCVDVGYQTATGAAIQGNKIHGCGKSANGSHDHGIYLEGAPNVTVKNNVIEDVCCGWTLQAWPYTTGVIEGNTLRAASGASEGGVIIAGGSKTTGLAVKGNTIVGNGRTVFDAYQLASNAATASGNCIVPKGSGLYEGAWVDGGTNRTVAAEADCASTPPPAAYHPACEPDCDAQIAGLKSDLAKALDQLKRILSIAQE